MTRPFAPIVGFCLAATTAWANSPVPPPSLRIRWVGLKTEKTKVTWIWELTGSGHWNRVTAESSPTLHASHQGPSRFRLSITLANESNSETLAGARKGALRESIRVESLDGNSVRFTKTTYRRGKFAKLPIASIAQIAWSGERKDPLPVTIPLLRTRYDRGPLAGGDRTIFVYLEPPRR